MESPNAVKSLQLQKRCKLKKGEIKRIHFKLIRLGSEWLVVAATIIRVGTGAFPQNGEKRGKRHAPETGSAGTAKHQHEKEYSRRTSISILFCWHGATQHKFPHFCSDASAGGGAADRWRSSARPTLVIFTCPQALASLPQMCVLGILQSWRLFTSAVYFTFSKKKWCNLLPHLWSRWHLST